MAAPPLPRRRLRPTWGAVVAFLRGGQRSLAADAAVMLRQLDPAPRLVGAENLPVDRPFVIVLNHYERPGLWVGWFVVAVSAAIAERTGRETRWLQQGELTEHRVLGLPLPRRLSRAAIARAAGVYGQLVLPVGAGQTHGRTAAIRAAVQALKTGCVGLFPEGYTSRALIAARPGSARLVALLHRTAGAPVVPAGVYEDGAQLVLHFGAPLDPAALTRLSGPAGERTLMQAIGRLLPPPLWGHYAADLAEASAV